MLDRLAEWEHLGTWVVALSILAFVGSLAVLPLLVVRMPADYFVHPEPKPGGWRDRHPAIRLAGHFLKNAIGVVLVAAGIVMLFTPGQGVLSLLVGLSLLDVPGKRTVELYIVSSPAIRRAIDAIRVRAGRPPIELP